MCMTVIKLHMSRRTLTPGGSAMRTYPSHRWCTSLVSARLNLPPMPCSLAVQPMSPRCALCPLAPQRPHLASCALPTYALTSGDASDELAVE